MRARRRRHGRAEKKALYSPVLQREQKKKNKKKTQQQRARSGCPISAACDSLAICVYRCTAVRVSDLSGMHALRHGLRFFFFFFSCAREMHVQLEFVQGAVWLRSV